MQLFLIHVSIEWQYSVTSDWKWLQTAHLVQNCSCISFVVISIISITIAIHWAVINNTKLLSYSSGDQKTYTGLRDYNQGAGRWCVSLGEGMTFILRIVGGIQVLIVVGLRAPCHSWLWAEGHFKPNVNGKYTLFMMIQRGESGASTNKLYILSHSWASYNSSQFWHYLPEGALSYQLSPTRAYSRC